MSSHRPDQRMSCTFCGISRENTKKLIQSPDKGTYICGTCAMDPDRLKPVSPQSKNQLGSAPSLSSRMTNFFRNRWSGTSQQQFRCSFCRNKKPSLGYYTSPLQHEVHAQICEECLAVCRQILLDEAKRDLVAANSAKS